MKKILKNTFTAILAFFFLISFSNEIKAEEQSNFHIATYITGIGCPHCANVAPGLLKEKVNECENNMIIIEYEIYDTPANSSVIFEFNSNYNSGLGIPMVIFSSENMLIGDREINNSFDNKCISADENIISLPDGRTVNLYELDLNDLPLYPRIWSRDKIAVRIGDEKISEDINALVINFLSSSNPSEVIESSDLPKAVSPEEIKISGGSVEFKNAVEVDGWVLQWNGNTSEILEDIKGSETKKPSSESSVSFVKTVTLALADSVNPCAIAILMMMLIAIVTYNPGSKKMVLLSGISFVGAVLVMYFIYGVFIVKFFDLIQSFKSIQAVITPVLSILMGIFSLILGFLEVKDFFNYKPGSFGTEMPLNLRPKVQKIISKVTSPWGAFVLGMFVTIFLLPCTIGPYFILGGLISTGSTAIGEMIPYLLLYNIIFVMPMIAVTAVIFFGVKNIDDVKNWKDKNVRILHLIAGILLTGLAVWVLIENIPSIISLFNIH